MGNTNASAPAEVKYNYNRNDFKTTKLIRNKFGNLRVVQNIKNSRFFIEKQLSFDSDQRLMEIKQGLFETSNARDVNYMRVYATQVSDKRLLCSISQVTMVIDFFDLTLEDMILKKTNTSDFVHEWAIWKILFDLAEVLQYNALNNIQNNFVHPKAVFFHQERDSWCLIHHAFFSENNYSEAVAGLNNYCSPELYCQIMSKKRTFYLMENDRSNMFSLAVIAMQLLHLEDQSFSHTSVYNQKALRVDVMYLHKFVDGLKSKGYSNLLVRTLNDMVQELEHLRLSPHRFMSLLSAFKAQLITKEFRNHTGVLKEYIEAKARQDDISFQEKMSHIYHDNNNGFDISEQFLQDNTMDHLKLKAVSFDPNFMARDSI